LCGTLWNYVRVKCTLCASTKGIAYQEIDVGAGNVKAETCTSCHGYLKVLQQTKDPDVDIIADDVASLGLDLLVREAGFRRGGVTRSSSGTEGLVAGVKDGRAVGRGRVEVSVGGGSIKKKK